MMLNQYPVYAPDDAPEPAGDPAERLMARWENNAAEDSEEVVEGEDVTQEEIDEDVADPEDPEGDEESQEDEDGEDDVGEEEETSDGFSSLEELLEAGEANPADLSVRVKVAGEEKDVTLEEAIRGYQRQADYDRHMQEVRSERDNLRVQSEDVNRQLTERVKELDLAINFAQHQGQTELEQLNREYNAVDWQGLRTEDPEEYAARMADFQRMEQSIRSRAGGLVQQMQQVREKVSTDLSAAEQRYYAEQGQKLRSLDGWQSDEDARQNLDTVFRYLTDSYGADNTELSRLVDHRIFDLARKAKLYDDLQGAGKNTLGETHERDPKTGQFVRKTAKKKVTRTLRPGGVASPGAKQRASGQRQEKALREKLSKEHSMDAASSLLAHRFSQQQR